MFQIQIINQFPNLTQIPTHRYNNRNMSKGDFSVIQQILYLQPDPYPSKKTYQVGRKSTMVSWPYPQSWPKYENWNENLQKNHPYHSLQVIGGKFGYEWLEKFLRYEIIEWNQSSVIPGYRKINNKIL